MHEFTESFTINADVDIGVATVTTCWRVLSCTHNSFILVANVVRWDVLSARWASDPPRGIDCKAPRYLSEREDSLRKA